MARLLLRGLLLGEVAVLAQGPVRPVAQAQARSATQARLAARSPQTERRGTEFCDPFFLLLVGAVGAVASQGEAELTAT
jgi:hypothetical protein